MAAELAALVAATNTQAVAFVSDWLPLLAWGLGITFGASVAVWVVGLVRG